MDRLRALRVGLLALRPYPTTMRELPDSQIGPIRGRAFFPGGSGLAGGENDPIAQRPLLVLGNDFGLYQKDYVAAVDSGAEVEAGTWGPLIALLRRADIALSECFFSNAIMGARVGGKNYDPSLALAERPFVVRCADFVRFQIATLRPRAVVMLGKSQATVIARAIPALAQLQKVGSWAELDAASLQFRPGLSLPEHPDTPAFAFCALMHTSFRASNMPQHGRRFLDLRDDAAEIELLRRAMAIGT